MAAHDSSWDTFRSELKHWMLLRKVTNKQLAEAINDDFAAAGLSAPIDEQIIKRWRHSTSPPLQALKVIARHLRMSADAEGEAPYDPTYLPRVMGLLDEAPESSDLIDAAYRLQGVRAKIAQLQSVLASTAYDEGIIHIVRAATRSLLACGVLPVIEGPHGYPMHVSDRIDIRYPAPDRPAPEMKDYPELADALHDAFAVKSRRLPRFTPHAELEHPGLTYWAVQYVGRPRTNAAHRPHPGLPALALTSITTVAWPDDIADLLAMVLGYGFTSTRDLARELVHDPYMAQSLRNDIHDGFLGAPAPERRIWTHNGIDLTTSSPRAPFLDKSVHPPSDLVQIFLLEDDEMLRHAALLPPGRRAPSEAETQEIFEDSQRTRDEVYARARELGPERRVFVIPVKYVATAEDRWEQAFDVTLSILKILDELGIEAHLDEWHARLARQEHNVAPQLFRWLADHGAPYVDASYATAR